MVVVEEKYRVEIRKLALCLDFTNSHNPPPSEEKLKVIPVAYNQ